MDSRRARCQPSCWRLKLSVPDPAGLSGMPAPSREQLCCPAPSRARISAEPPCPVCTEQPLSLAVSKFVISSLRKGFESFQVTSPRLRLLLLTTTLTGFPIPLLLTQTQDLSSSSANPQTSHSSCSSAPKGFCERVDWIHPCEFGSTTHGCLYRKRLTRTTARN